MTRFVKTLIIINGILIPLVFVVFFVFLFFSLNNSGRYKEPETGVMTKNVVQKDSNIVARQGLEYTAPSLIKGTENYCITVSVKTYEHAEPINRRITKLSYLNSENDETDYFNVIFLDKNYNVLRRLLNKKASITYLEQAKNDESLKIDSSVKNIAYRIVFEDTNQDGILNNKDLSDLYISGVAGDNLTKITSNINIKSVDFYNKNTMLFLEYTDRKNEPDEYKDLKFATYSIQERKLTMLNGISKEVSNIKEILNKK